MQSLYVVQTETGFRVGTARGSGGTFASLHNGLDAKSRIRYFFPHALAGLLHTFLTIVFFHEFDQVKREFHVSFEDLLTFISDEQFVNNKQLLEQKILTSQTKQSSALLNIYLAAPLCTITLQYADCDVAEAFQKLRIKHPFGAQILTQDRSQALLIASQYVSKTHDQWRKIVILHERNCNVKEDPQWRTFRETNCSFVEFGTCETEETKAKFYLDRLSENPDPIDRIVKGDILPLLFSHCGDNTLFVSLPEGLIPSVSHHRALTLLQKERTVSFLFFIDPYVHEFVNRLTALPSTLYIDTQIELATEARQHVVRRAPQRQLFVGFRDHINVDSVMFYLG